MKSIKSLKNLKNKRVLVRVDYNVSLKNGKIVDPARILASVPTIEYLLKVGAQVILLAHLGRPNGQIVPELSLQPIAKYLAKILGRSVKFVDSMTKDERLVVKDKLVMLENIRFYAGEEKNDKIFTKQLASLADIFVLDGFGVAHRSSASVTGLTKYLPSYAGLLLEKEVQTLGKIMSKPKAPFLLFVGGAKMETKVPVLKKLSTKTDLIFLGGGVANTFWAAQGFGVGKSLVDAKYGTLLKQLSKKYDVIYPLDVIVGNLAGTKFRTVEVGNTPHQICAVDEGIYDVGPKTIKALEFYFKSAQTILWNGAMGMMEQKSYAGGSLALARAIVKNSSAKCLTVAGGGETLAAINQAKVSQKFRFISTGGGAMLEFLSGKKLAGIVNLK